ncbi:hypothetical protein CAEBREN_15605 [Caenorhabditis brenneri]|uniref:histone acetyltransferase n=1 Tax=Caenorhabditis brenneri TaxID=135651 RepID=G0NKU7_CAEBE|nr:hypothetical protein CAEBREN_15605 [Caenorhabditis brenneri]
MRIKKINKAAATRSNPRNHPVAVVDRDQSAQDKENGWQRSHKWCTINYLDSVPYFTRTVGGVKKTQVYDEIIYSYFEYSKMIGFERIHIFVCAIEGKNEYFFHRRPTLMELPDQDMLMSWYERLLHNGKKEIVWYVNTQRPTDGRRSRNRSVEDFIFEVSYSKFYRLAMEEELKSNKFSRPNFERVIESYPEERPNRLLFVHYKTKEVEGVEIEEETIDHKLTKSRSNWLKTLRKNDLSFASIDEAKNCCHSQNARI